MPQNFSFPRRIFRGNVSQKFAKNFWRGQIDEIPAVTKSRVFRVKIKDLAAFPRIFFCVFELQNENQKRTKPGFVPRIFQQNFEIAEVRLWRKFFRDFSGLGNGDAEKFVEFCVFSGRSFEKSTQRFCLFWRSRGFELEKN